MADGTFPGLISKDRAVNAVGNPIWVELTDGTTALSVTAGKLDVNAAATGTLTMDVAYDYAVSDIAGATDVGAMVLAVRTDSPGTLTPIDGDYVQLQTTSTGALWVARVALNLTDDAVKISKDANANSVLNPIFVQNVSAVTTSDEINNRDDVTSTGETPENHDYTVAGTTFLLKSVVLACSGAMKATIQTGPVGSLATKAVVFLTGRQGDTKQVFFDPPIEVPVTSTGTVRVVKESRNGTGVNVSLYSEIIGNDVP